ncbi:MAG: site-2 protease family protein [Oscillospiraceae bacterium]|jgi:Zn-dependent protease|nr:site-2 protease family protein [Oscillospiraceae bacterium]
MIDWGMVSMLLTRVLSVLLCLTVHETCHGLVAYALGDPTAKRMHRLSFNPLHHIDWVGLAAMLLVGFGWAKPVPVDMRYFKDPKKGMALTALAGPMSNFLMAALCCIPLRWLLPLVLRMDNLQSPLVWLYNFLITLILMNLGLGLFNLLPIPPLDGSKVLFALLPDRAYLQLMRYERYGMLLLILLVSFDVGSDFLSEAIFAVFTFLINLLVL